MPTVAEIAALLGVKVHHGSERTISGIASLERATPGELSYLSSDEYLSAFRQTRAAAVIVDEKVTLPPVSPGEGPSILLVRGADVALAKLIQAFAPPVPRPPAGVDRSARIGAETRISPDACIGPNVVIGARSSIGARCVIHPGVVISDQVVMGEDCEIFPNVVIRERITIGQRVIIHASSVLGTDGFGYAWDGEKHAKIPQIGSVLIEDDVEIGSCVCVDRAKLGTTIVGRGTKIDNLVQIAHNCVVGKHCIIVGQVGLAGTVTLGDNVRMGGQSGIRDHVTVGSDVFIAARSGVVEDVESQQSVSGQPSLPHRQSLREQAAMRRLPHLVVQVRKLEDQIAELKARLDGQG